MNRPTKPITTPYNDKDNKNNINIDDKKSLKKSGVVPTYKGVIPVNDFYPKTYEEQRCWEIAYELGEVDMRFILSCLKKYGFGHIEMTWGIFKETPQENINSKPKYFNRLIRNLWK